MSGDKVFLVVPQERFNSLCSEYRKYNGCDPGIFMDGNLPGAECDRGIFMGGNLPGYECDPGILRFPDCGYGNPFSFGMNQDFDPVMMEFEALIQDLCGDSNNVQQRLQSPFQVTPFPFQRNVPAQDCGCRPVSQAQEPNPFIKEALKDIAENDIVSTDPATGIIKALKKENGTQYIIDTKKNTVQIFKPKERGFWAKFFSDDCVDNYDYEYTYKDAEGREINTEGDEKEDAIEKSLKKLEECRKEEIVKNFDFVNH